MRAAVLQRYCRCIAAILVLTILVVPVQSQHDKDINQMIQIMKKVSNLNIHNLGPIIDKVEASEFANNNCMAELNMLYNGLKQGNLTSTYFFDALGKPGSGLLTGNFLMMGDYDMCLRMKKSSKDVFIPCKSSATATATGYPLPFTWTTCLPTECQGAGFDAAVNTMLPLIELYLKDFVKITNFKTVCYTNLEYDVGAYIAIVLVSVILFLVLIGSLWHPLLSLVHSFSIPEDKVVLITDYDKEEQSPNKTSIQHDMNEGGGQLTILGSIMTCFSLQKNLPSFLSTDTKEGQVLCLNGIRFISINWVVFCHMYLVPFVATSDFHYFAELMARKSFQIVLNGFPSVDSFFVLSGFLVSYLLLKTLARKEGKFEAVGYYLHRYIRLTIPFGLVILIEGFLYPIYITGNFPDAFQQEHEVCKRHWWTNLLYINNLYPWKEVEVCVAQSWYLANDMQLFFVAPIFIILLYYSPKIGNMVIQVTIWTSAILAGWITYHYNLGPNTMTGGNMGMENFRILYRVPWVRCTPYLLGITAGWIYWRWSAVMIKWSVGHPAWKKLIISLVVWIVTIAIEYAVVFGLYDVTAHPEHSTKLKSVCYESLSRIAWSIALIIQIFACQTGLGGWINSCLSWKGFLPLSRLTYSVYLLHFGIATALITQLRHPFFYKTDFEMVVIYLGILIVSYGASVLMYVMVEQPVGFLERISYRKA